MAVNARATRVAFIALAAVGSSGAFSPYFPLPPSSVRIPFKSSAATAAVLTQTRSTLVSRRRHRHLGQKQPSHAGLFLFGFGGGGSSSASSRSSASPASSKARKAVESNAVFKSRTEQVRGRTQKQRCCSTWGDSSTLSSCLPDHQQSCCYEYHDTRTAAAAL